MDFRDSPEDAAFRAEWRSWLESHASRRSGEQRGFGALVAQGFEDPDLVARAKDWQAELAADRWAAIHWPAEYGGRSATPMQTFIYGQELAEFDVPLDIYSIGLGMIGPTLMTWGTDDQKDDWLPRLCSGQKLAAFGLTEPEAGSDAGNTQTRASLDGGEWVVNGAKQFITNSGTEISGCVTITAVTGETDGTKEISNLIVPNGTPGYEPGEPYRKMGWNASDTRPLTFDGCRVPE